MDRLLELFLGVPMKVMVASYTLNLAADTAVKMVDDQWVPKAHGLCRVIGLDGLTTFLGCFGLFLAYLICTFGLTAGVRTSPTPSPGTYYSVKMSDTILTGFCVFAVGAAAGTCAFFLFHMLVTLGHEGLILSGFFLAAILLMEYNHQRYNARVSSPRMLVLFSLTFTTMLFAVQTSYNFSNVSTICILPSVILLGFSLDKTAFKKPRGSIILSMILIVPFTGVVLGFGIDEYYIKYPLASETANTLNSVVYKTVLLTGLVGTVAGALIAYFWIEQEANGLSLWICCPAAAILYNLDIDSKHLSLHSLLNNSLGPGGELGLITSFAALSGLSFGLVLKYAHIMLPLEHIFVMLIILGLLFHYCLVPSMNLYILAAMALCIGVLSTMDLNNRLVPLQEAAWDFAILAKTMMGATILGLAGLLTLALGAPGFWGMLLAFVVVMWKACVVSRE
ncbi:uncharacterized protein LOC117383545 [Periophthalmus magnuspinnatus]|uniref:uncharacterized protein LOC117383545 n=1 Tax=Periophthalmus magnuspinnatus TaxID=409849 RepID=UPI00145AB757|nr:uncharacterized protein LOC117383545 [Periophthalmus magnuspinnatus]